MKTFFSHLECSVPCSAGPYDPRQAHTMCTCGAPLFSRYDLTAAQRWPRSALSGRESTIWRYREILPLLESDKGGVDFPITLGEGWTPLLRARRLAKAVGLDRVFIKDESQNPTGSFKARGAAVALTRAIHVGAKRVLTSRPGHAASAAAAYAARVALPSVVGSLGAGQVSSGPDPGTYGAATFDATTVAEELDCDISPFREPYALEGLKTIGLEIAEQFSWQLPDWLLVPTGSGATIVALWKAFSEMGALGWIDPARRPHMVAVQAAGCAPLVRAFGSKSERAAPWDNPQTAAAGLLVSETPGDMLALRVLNESLGHAIAVGDSEMLAGAHELGRHEGIGASREGGATVHALRLLTADGRIKPHHTIVLLNPAAAEQPVPGH